MREPHPRRPQRSDDGPDEEGSKKRRQKLEAGPSIEPFIGGIAEQTAQRDLKAKRSDGKGQKGQEQGDGSDGGWKAPQACFAENAPARPQITTVQTTLFEQFGSFVRSVKASTGDRLRRKGGDSVRPCITNFPCRQDLFLPRCQRASFCARLGVSGQVDGSVFCPRGGFRRHGR